MNIIEGSESQLCAFVCFAALSSILRSIAINSLLRAHRLLPNLFNQNNFWGESCNRTPVCNKLLIKSRSCELRPTFLQSRELSLFFKSCGRFLWYRKQSVMRIRHPQQPIVCIGRLNPRIHRTVGRHGAELKMPLSRKLIGDYPSDIH